MKRNHHMFRLFSLMITVPVLLSGSVIANAAETEENAPKKFALVTKSIGNPYFKTMGEGFTEVIEDAGAEAVICEPANPYADDQIFIIDSLIVQDVSGIALAANDYTRLASILSAAKDAGISVITVDSDTEADERTVFCNQASEAYIAETLMNEIREEAGGEGSFAIVSTTPDASNQNAWISEMKNLLDSNPEYADLELTEIVYGEDNEEVSAEKTTELLKRYPDLKVICAPTAAGIPGVAKAVQEADSTVRVTGLGMPSQMAEFIGTDRPCSHVYMWNPSDLGKLAAYTCLALDSGEITGKEGDSLTADALPDTPYSVTLLPGKEEGTEILLNELICFSEDNIDEWKDLF